MNRRIRHVDAFTATPLEGNPAAVVDGEGLSGELMQRIALNQHLAETVFLLPPEDAANHAHIRIFTPTVELPFAGHPTIAAAHTLISERSIALRDGETLRLETGVGVIPVDNTKPLLFGFRIKYEEDAAVTNRYNPKKIAGQVTVPKPSFFSAALEHETEGRGVHEHEPKGRGERRTKK